MRGYAILRNCRLLTRAQILHYCCAVSHFRHTQHHSNAGTPFISTGKLFLKVAAAFEGELIPASQIDRLATLPTYEEAIARLMATMKEASAGKLVRTLAAVRDAKEAA